MIQVSGISQEFGGNPLFSGISFRVNPGERLGLVGPNGAGKTTLLRILAGQLEPTEGAVSRDRGATLALFEQDGVVQNGRTVRDELLSALGHVQAIVHEQEEVDQRLRLLDPDSPEFEALLHRQHELIEQYHRLNGSEIDARLGVVLAGLGFQQGDEHRLTSEFSGGWRQRLALAKVLIVAPDVLLLDEPTNHLDLDAREWVESFLARYRGALVVVSHDRYFLDRVVNRVVELDRGKLTHYSGNYTQYLKQRAERQERQAAAYKRQQIEIARQERFIERFRAKATKARAVKSREKALERIERIAPPERDNPTVRFRWPVHRPSGREVLTVRDLSKRFGEKTVFTGVSFRLERGDRLALVGPNGAGKSTLMRILAGTDVPTSGSIELGHAVLPAYFAQQQAEELNPANQVIDELREVAPGVLDGELRSLLGRFLFRGEAVFKSVSVLSGGERNRLALAKLLLQPANLLLLDEPTNHLDIATQEVLESALRDYPGTVVLVSHDRYFLDRVVQKVLAFEPGRVRLSLGTYSEYVARRESERQAASSATPSPATQPAGASAQPAPAQPSTNGTAAESPPARRRVPKKPDLERKIAKLEARIEELEAEGREVDALLQDPDTYRDPVFSAEVIARHTSLQADLERLTAEWEEAALLLEELTAG